MKTGTKSILWGAHCFFLHPFFVAAAWTRLYGFPWDPRLWVCFLVHDLGYWGMAKMDDEIGEQHPEFGANLVSAWFDDPIWYSKTYPLRKWVAALCNRIWGEGFSWPDPHHPGEVLWMSWHSFCFFHSRFLAKRHNRPFSLLCVADKLSFALTPAWIYLPMVHWSGEIREYMKEAESGKYVGENKYDRDPKKWHANLREYILKWVAEHRDGRDDTWNGRGAATPLAVEEFAEVKLDWSTRSRYEIPVKDGVAAFRFTEYLRRRGFRDVWNSGCVIEASGLSPDAWRYEWDKFDRQYLSAGW